MGKKGFEVLKSFCYTFGYEQLDCVVSNTNLEINKDYYYEISKYCSQYGIKFIHKSEAKDLSWRYAFAIGWRWLIPNPDNLIILHDSLLPRYRGFAPVVNALLNKETTIGVTALFASENYDEGDIIDSREMNILESCPKIADVIDQIIPLYCDLVCSISEKLLANETLKVESQDHSKATYSLWRDEDDYNIDWTWSIYNIRRFIAAVGSPFKGAATTLNGSLVRILDADSHNSLDHNNIENLMSFEQEYSYGKIFRIENGHPIVICRDGLLEIKEMVDDNNISLLPWTKLKSRFR